MDCKNCNRDDSCSQFKELERENKILRMALDPIVNCRLMQSFNGVGGTEYWIGNPKEAVLKAQDILETLNKLK